MKTHRILVTGVNDLAKVIFHIIQSGKLQTLNSQIYHYSNYGVVSWYDFAMAVFSISGIKCQVVPIESKDFPTRTKRPDYSVLNKNKITSDFNLSIPYWRDSFIKCIKEIVPGYTSKYATIG
jgi:dTDP-4-dehydrorhamnose reductase